MENLSRLDFCAVAIRAIYCKEVFVLNWWVYFFYDRKAREDLDAKNKKLAEMEADYGDVVPRRDFERLEAQFNVRNTKMSCEFQKV